MLDAQDLNPFDGGLTNDANSLDAAANLFGLAGANNNNSGNNNSNNSGGNVNNGGGGGGGGGRNFKNNNRNFGNNQVSDSLSLLIAFFSF